MNKQHLPIGSIATFVLGAVIGFTLVLLATWADVEAQDYGFYRRANTPLHGLNCPVFMARDGVGKISLRLTNRTDNPLSPNVRTEISTPALPSLHTQSVKLAPGESKTLTWTIGPENIDLGYFVFTEILVYSIYPLPDRESICGTLVVNLPIEGNTLMILMMVLSLLGMGVGLYGIYRSHYRSRRMDILRFPLMFLTGLLAISMAMIFFEWWLQTSIILVVIFLLVLVLAGRLVTN